MRLSFLLTGPVVLALTAIPSVVHRSVAVPASSPPPILRVAHGVGPALHSIGSLAFGPRGLLYIADPDAATIYALQLGTPAMHPAPGTKPITALGRALAAALGTEVSQITLTDGVVVDPATRNTYLAIMRGQGSDAAPALMRIDGTGTITVVDLTTLPFTSVTLPDAQHANPTSTDDASTFSITHIAVRGSQLYVAGLSTEEFASTLWTIALPLTAAGRGTSIAIYHDNHDDVETAAPIYTFLPATVGTTPSLIAGYLCSPLVTLPVAALTPGAKVTGRTIADLGGYNRPVSMLTYQKGGAGYLLVANTNQQTMRFAMARIAAAPAITASNAQPTEAGEGVPHTMIKTLHGVLWLDHAGADSAEVIRRTPNGRLDLVTVPLP